MRGFRSMSGGYRLLLARALLFAVFSTTAGMRAHGGEADASIRSIEDLNGKRLAILVGTSLDFTMSKHLDYAQFIYFDTFAMMDQALLNGDVDAIVGDFPILGRVAAERPDLRLLDKELKTGESYGFATRPDESVLCGRINGAVKELRNDGTLARLADKWLKGGKGKDESPAESDDAKGKLLRMGTYPTLPPFSYLDAAGKVIGYDIEIAHLVAGRMDCGLSVVTMEFSELIPALLAGDVDFIGGAVTITPEREKIIRFTESYHQIGLGALVKEHP